MFYAYHHSSDITINTFRLIINKYIEIKLKYYWIDIFRAKLRKSDVTVQIGS